jgi:hypothetical protein
MVPGAAPGDTSAVVSGRVEFSPGALRDQPQQRFDLLHIAAGMSSHQGAGRKNNKEDLAAV